MASGQKVTDLNMLQGFVDDGQIDNEFRVGVIKSCLNANGDLVGH